MIGTYLFLKRAKLSFALIVVLDFIYRNPGCLIDEIARAMHSTRTPVWNKVHFLRKKGLVESEPYPYGRDCRRRSMHVTEQGRKTMQKYYSL